MHATYPEPGTRNPDPRSVLSKLVMIAVNTRVLFSDSAEIERE
jgi:hypothetical protein